MTVSRSTPRSRARRYLLRIVIALPCLGLVAWLAVKAAAVGLADAAARGLVDEALSASQPAGDDEAVIAIGRRVFEKFEHSSGSAPLLRLRGWLTNARLPALLRLPEGVIETLVREGLCDNAARMLAYALKLEGFTSRQWNMVSPAAAHSGLLVRMGDGREVLVDPFYGFISADRNGRLIHPEAARARVRAGEAIGAVLQPLGTYDRSEFYDLLAVTDMAAQGDALRMQAVLPGITDGPLYLGEIDGEASDVSRAAAGHGMGPYWHYVGHRYSRQWVRELTAGQHARLEFTLIDEPRAGMLTADPAPTVRERVLSWELHPGDSVRFVDGRARFSLARRGSYLGVDRIAIVPLD